MLEKALPALVLFTMWIAAAACQRDPFAGQYTTSKPREEDIVGKCTFFRDTVTWGDSTRIKQCHIGLRRDGTFMANNVPRARVRNFPAAVMIFRRSDWRYIRNLAD